MESREELEELLRKNLQEMEVLRQEIAKINKVLNLNKTTSKKEKKQSIEDKIMFDILMKGSKR